MPSQRNFMEDLSPEVMYSGAFGAGKSRVGLEKILFLCLRYPNNATAVFRKTFTSLRFTTMETFWRDVVPPNWVSGKDYTYNKVTHEFILPNNSKIFFLGIDEPTRIGGLEVSCAFIDEVIDLTEDDYIMILGRKRLSTVPFRQVMSATNPGPPSHWMYHRAFTDQKVKVFTSSALDNPFLPQDYIDTLMGFTGLYRRRYVLGEWVGFQGLVYDNWDPDNLIDPFDIPEEWPRYRVIDFGYTNPFVCGWFAHCPPSKEELYLERGWKGYYLYRQLYMTQQIVTQHAAIINSFPEDIANTFADHDAEDRATLEQKGIPTTKAQKAVTPGLQAVHEVIDEGRLHIFRDCLIERDPGLIESKLPTSIEQEFGNYIWADMPFNKNQKEIPVDKDNHGMDIIRYLVQTLEGKPTHGVIAGRRNDQRVRKGKTSRLLPDFGNGPRNWGRERSNVGWRQQ